MLENGFYLLFDDQGQRYLAYCDLASAPGAAWTLVISWTSSLKTLPQFRRKSFMQDARVNENTPNWHSYRQTLARMKNIRSRSTHCRATCSFNQVEAIDYRDYIRGKFSDLDIMSFSGRGVCFPVEYLNIRGHGSFLQQAVVELPHLQLLLKCDSRKHGVLLREIKL